MIGPNELLYWMSANVSGSWGQFRSAVDEFLVDAAETDSSAEQIPLYHRVRFNFQQLGHVEFDAETCFGGWRVAPPALAITESVEGPVAVLCGARLPALVQRLCAGENGIIAERQAVADGPEVIRLRTSETAKFQSFASQANIHFQDQAAISILRCLPRITDLHSWHCKRAEMPFGHDTKVQRFELSRRFCRWTDCAARDARDRDGLYRFTRFQRREHYLRFRGDNYRVRGQFGNYFIAAQRQRSMLQYNRSRREIQVPAICRPPLLVDRALIICSGFPPAHDPTAGTLTYSDVPENIAGLAAFVVCQERL